MMKHILIIALTLICSNFLKAQDTTFNKYLYPYTGMTNINSLLISDSFYYSLILIREPPSLIQKIGVLKIDNTGSIINSKTISFGNKHSYVYLGHGFSIADSNNFIFCGNIWSSTEASKGVVVKVNSNLDTLWTKEFSHPDTISLSQANPNDVYMTFNDIKETPDGGYIIVGNYNKDCTASVRSLLIKTDSNGNIENYYSNNFESQTYDIEINPYDSGYVYLCVANNSLYLNKANKYGETEWKYSLTTNYLHRAAQDITFLNDSIIIIGSPYIYQENGHPNALDIAMFNINSKTLIWRNYYQLFHSFRSITLDQSININITKDNNIVVSGTSIVVGTSSSEVGTRGAILKLNQNGDSLWSRYYAHNWDDSTNVDMQLNDLVVCDDGGFLFGGYAIVHSTGFANSWLVKTDSMGMTKAAFTLGLEKNTLVIKKSKPLLYPNPATDNFNLRFKENPTENYELSIYSSSGALVKQKQLAAFGNEYRINIQKLKSGVYFIRLKSGGEIVYSSKFIKQ